MAYTYPVKWITSTMRGAPPISGTAGTYIAALDAFLLTGWGTANAVSVSVVGGVGTAQFAEGVFFEDFSVVQLANVTTPAALNGEARVLSHTNNAITFETDAPDGVATTGTTITVKYAPVGNWSKPFFGTNLAAYKSTHIQASGHFKRVDDTGTTTSRVVGYESMTDINTGSGAFPTAGMAASGGYVHKSLSANATAVRYSMAADARTLLTAIEPGTATGTGNRNANVRGFGDSIPQAPGGDSWVTFLSAFGTSTNGQFNYGALSGGTTASSNLGFVAAPRAYVGLGSAVWMDIVPCSGTLLTASGMDPFMGAAPSTVDGQIKLARVFLKEQVAGSPPRCTVPGVLYVPQTGVSSILAAADIAPGSGDWAGRKLLAVATGAAHNGAGGIAFIDITGPWRA